MVAEAAGSGRPWRGKDGRGIRPDPGGAGRGCMKGSHRAGQSRSSQKSRKSGKRGHKSQGGGGFKQKKAGIPTQRGSRAVKG